MFEKQITTHLAKAKETSLIGLYKNTFPMVAKFVSKRGGSFDQAKDVFQDALVIWYEKGGRSHFAITQSNQAYLFGIAKHLWYRKFSEVSKSYPLDSLSEEELEGAAEAEVSSAKLITLLEAAGRKCLEVLKSFYYDRLSMTELAAGFGFKSVHSATVQKYKCLEKVRETVKEKALSYEDFLD